MFRCSNPIIGLAVPDDVYVDYGIFILSSAMRLSVLKLDVRTDLDDDVQVNRLSESASASTSNPRLLTNSSMGQQPTPEAATTTTTYMSILAHEPYKPPPILSGQVPLAPKLSLPPNSSSKEFTLTPDTLRFLLNTVSQLSYRIREVCAAQRDAEARVTMQGQEVGRMCEKVREIEGRIGRLRAMSSSSSASSSASAPPEKGGPTAAGGGERIAKIKLDQEKLLERTEGLLSAMMRKASPEISEYEKEWFDELKRMRVKVGGMKGAHSGGAYETLSARVRTVSGTTPPTSNQTDSWALLMASFFADNYSWRTSMSYSCRISSG